MLACFPCCRRAKYQIGMAFALLLHIFEEEFFPGGFGFSFNTVKNPKDYSDCYPMNPMISMTVNFLGVLFLTISAFFPSLYFLFLREKAVWGLGVVLRAAWAFSAVLSPTAYGLAGRCFLRIPLSTYRHL